MSATVAKVEMAFATGANPNAWTLDVSPFPVTLGPAEIDVWTDVTDDVQTLNITRGRSRELDAFAPGTCQVLMLNEDRDYDPLNLDGPHVNTEATQERQSTLSDGVITDAMREAGVQGDGFPTPAGMGPWPALTNKVTQPVPGATATTNVAFLGTGSLTLVDNDGAPFENGDGKVWRLEATSDSAQAVAFFAGQVGSTDPHSISIWARLESGDPAELVLSANEGLGQAQITSSEWTRVSNPNLTPGASTRTLTILFTSARVGAVRFVAAQLETGTIATPFTPTSRVAGRIQAAVADLGITAETGWMFVRETPGVSSAAGQSSRRSFSWRDGSNNGIEFGWVQASTRYEFSSIDGGTSSTAVSAGTSLTAGTGRSTGAAWNGTGADSLKLSLNGAAPTTASRGTVPTIGVTDADIGRAAFSASLYLLGNADWVVTGSDGSKVSNADSAALHTLAETLDRAPTWAEVQSVLSGDARLSMEALLPMVDGEFQVVTRKTQIRPGRRIRVTAEHPDTNVEYPVFYGIVREWDVNYPNQIGAVVARATDLMTDLAVTDVEVTTSAGTPGNAFRQVMAAAGISRFTAVSGSSTLQETVFSTPALQATQLIEQSELGTAYTDRDGIIRFEGRNTVLSQERSAVSQATFGAGHLLFRDLELDYDSDQIRNAISLTRDGGTAQTAESTDSIAEYGKRSFSRSGLMNATDSELEDLADYLLGGFSEPAVRVRSITIDPMNHPDLLTQALAREIRDRVTVQYQPPAGGTQISQEVFISGIQHQLSSGGAMTTKFSFETTDLAYGWVLDVSAFPVRLGA